MVYKMVYRFKNKLSFQLHLLHSSDQDLFSNSFKQKPVYLNENFPTMVHT